jgi:hypothetical protein
MVREEELDYHLRMTGGAGTRHGEFFVTKFLPYFRT